MKNTPISEEEFLARRRAFQLSWKRTALDVLVLALSGAALTLAFPGVDFEFAAWVAVIPLIVLTARRTPKRAFLYGLVWGYAWNLTSCFFLREIMFFIPFIFALVLGLFSALWALTIPVLFRVILYPKSIRAAGSEAMSAYYDYPPWAELLCVFGLSAWWVCLEWIRSWFFTGFPWNLLAVTQWRNLNFIQICEFTGIYGVSFLIVFMNTALYFAIHGFRRSLARGRYKRPYPFLLAAVLCIGNAWLGNQTYQWRKAEYRADNQSLFAVGVVQPHLSQRRAAGEREAVEALEVCSELSRRLLAEDRILRSGELAALGAGVNARSGAKSGTAAPSEVSVETARELAPLQLVIWPESAVPLAYFPFTDPLSLQYRNTVRTMLKESGVPFLIGTITWEPGPEPSDWKAYNSALLLKNHPRPAGGDSLYEREAQYSKVHLVPFGEFVPLNDRYPWLGKMIGMGRNLTPGPGFSPLDLAPGVRAGMLICYEDVFPCAARAQALAGANLLTVITNDAWYPTSYEPIQHYANSLFRAIETRLPMLRCGNSDYSVLIDPRGETIDSVFRTVNAATGEFTPDPGRKGAGAAKFIVRVPKQHRPTFYTRFGDVFVLACWIVVFGVLLVGLVRRFEFQRLLTDPLDSERKRIRDSFRDGPAA